MEKWDAYDKNLQKTGQLLKRGEPVPEGFYHLVVNVFVRHQDGDWLFMKRSHEKEIYPNYYECEAGGSVLAGESSQTAARRELKEETGLIPYSLQLMDQERDDADHCHFDYYLAEVGGSKSAISYQSGETDGHIWVSSAAVPAFLDSHLVFETQRKWILRYLKKNLLDK